MKRRLIASAVALVVCLVGLSWQTVPVGAGVNDFWNPPVMSQPITSACDATWGHLQPTRVTPSSGFTIPVTVPPQLVVDTLTLRYSINGGATSALVRVTPS